MPRGRCRQVTGTPLCSTLRLIPCAWCATRCAVVSLVLVDSVDHEVTPRVYLSNSLFPSKSYLFALLVIHNHTFGGAFTAKSTQYSKRKWLRDLYLGTINIVNQGSPTMLLIGLGLGIFFLHHASLPIQAQHNLTSCNSIRSKHHRA